MYRREMRWRGGLCRLRVSERRHCFRRQEYGNGKQELKPQRRKLGTKQGKLYAEETGRREGNVMGRKESKSYRSAR